MDREWRDEWVRALRSGEFKQGRKAMRHAGRYCCLGVLTQLRPDARWDGGGAIGPEGDGGAGILPNSLRDELDIHPFEIDHLVEMNDGYKSGGIRQHTFAEIADWIEANL